MWEAVGAVAASISVMVAMVVLLVSLYKTKPNVSVRWKIDHKDMSVEFINTGERTAERVKAIFDLDAIRKSSNNYHLFMHRDDRIFTLLPGEGYAVPIASIYQVAHWMADEAVPQPLAIRGEWKYRSWPLRRLKRADNEWKNILRWDDYHNTLIPSKPAEETLVESVDKLTKAVKPAIEEIGYQLKRRQFEQSNEDRLTMRPNFASRAHLQAWSIVKELNGHYTKRHYLGDPGKRLVFRVREHKGGTAMIEIGYEWSLAESMTLNGKQAYEDAFDKVKVKADSVWKDLQDSNLLSQKMLETRS